jgi:glycine cleavage system H lipoate-binding protein
MGLRLACPIAGEILATNADAVIKPAAIVD